MSRPDPIKVVIVGGGFAGISAALKLANQRGIAVTLVSDESFFEYRPALYRSATGRSLFEVAIPLRDFFSFARNINIVKDKIISFDISNHQVVAEYGEQYRYDKLILALGSVTAYFGIDGLEENSFGVKTVAEAVTLKRHIHDQLLNDKPDRNYIVVGAGATGVELSAEMVGYIEAIYKKHNIKHQAEVRLIEAAPRAMPAMPEDVSKRIDRRLTELGIKTFYNVAVQAGAEDHLELPGGDVPSRTVVWTAGMANNPLFAMYPDIFKLGRGQRVEVDSGLMAAKDIYVVGDSALTEFSGMAQTAQYDGSFVATNIIRELRGQHPLTYSPKRPVYATPVGPNWAAVLWGKLRFYGAFGAFLRKLADLRFYFSVLSIRKAFSVWRYSQKSVESCPVCDSGVSTPAPSSGPEVA